MKQKFERILIEAKESLARIYKKRFAGLVLYGSYARGEAYKSSDIDLMVILKGKVIPGKEVDHMMDAVYDLSLKYDELISVYHVSVNMYNKSQSPLVMNAKKEGIRI